MSLHTLCGRVLGLLLCTVQLVRCFQLDLTRQTFKGKISKVIQTLKPTTTAVAELAKRQQQPPSNTCGYEVIDLYSLTCGSQAPYCGQQSAYSAVGCCSTYTQLNGINTPLGCGFYTSCYDSTAAFQCTGSCQGNPLVLQCMQSTSPYCFTYTFIDIGSTVLACDTVRLEVLVQVTSPSSASSVRSLPRLPGWVTTTFIQHSATPIASNPTTELNQTSATPAIENGPFMHIGAIVGGLVGTLLGMVLLIGIGLFFYLRKRPW